MPPNKTETEAQAVPGHVASPDGLGVGSEASNPWRDAIDEALIASGLDCLGPDEKPVEALARLIQWEKQMALDPSISKEAADLLNRWPPCTFVPSGHLNLWCATCGYNKFNPRHANDA